MRRILIGLSIAVLSPNAALAFDADEIEVLGVHLGVSKEDVPALLAPAGFTFRESLVKPCENTYSAFIDEMVTKRRTRFESVDMSCIAVYVKGDDKVRIQYVLTPRGYIVHEVEYSFSSAETDDEMKARLSSKFGRPCQNYPRMGARWSNSANCGVADANIRYSGSSRRHNLTMSGGIDAMNKRMRQAVGEIDARIPKVVAPL